VGGAGRFLSTPFLTVLTINPVATPSVNDEADAPANKHKHKIARVEDFIDTIEMWLESQDIDVRLDILDNNKKFIIQFSNT